MGTPAGWSRVAVDLLTPAAGLVPASGWSLACMIHFAIDLLLSWFIGFSTERARQGTYPPKERFLRTLSEGSLWFWVLSFTLCYWSSCDWFSLGTRLTYCVVGGGWCVGGGWVVGRAYFGLFSKRRIINHEVWRFFYIEQKLHSVRIDLTTNSSTILWISHQTMVAVGKFDS